MWKVDYDKVDIYTIIIKATTTITPQTIIANKQSRKKKEKHMNLPINQKKVERGKNKLNR